MRRSILVVLALVAAACSDAAHPGTTTTRPDSTMPPATTAPPTTPPPTPTTSGATTTTLDERGDPPMVPDLIVANDDGVFLVEPEFLAQLVGGGAELAKDDGRGGVVFQRPQRFPYTPESTITYYLDPAATEPRAILVPTGEQYLTLHDVEDGVIWYTRTEGDSPDSATQTLRTYDLAARTVTEIGVTGGWESGVVDVSVDDEVIASYWFAEALSGFDISTPSGDGGFPGDPYQGGALFCADGTLVVADGAGDESPGCFEWPAIGDGLLAFIEVNWDEQFPRHLLVVTDLRSGDGLLRTDLERPDQGWLPSFLEVRGDLVLVNRRTFDGDGASSFIPALVVDIATGGHAEAGLAGRASFLRGPMAISS